ncbi:MAG: hypothetical protein JST15_04920 [Bacteroidetes bacterium]|nr:hypothetical protein [Bacteroidota bacterium]
MKPIQALIAFLILFFFISQKDCYTQDLYENIINPRCGTGSSFGDYCGFPTYFPMTNDTLKALVIFAVFHESNWDPINNNSSIIYM